MKTLLLLRHAKSSWSNQNLSDFQRPLNDRGRHDAPRVGQLLRREGLVPDLIIASSAVRAATTAEMVALEASFGGDIRYTERLYLAEPETYISLARQLDDDIASVMLVGHNPGIEELVEWLAGQYERMTTAALAHIRAPIDSWTALSGGMEYELASFWRPRELP